MPLAHYNGLHTYSYTRKQCASSDCAEAPSPVPHSTYWRCRPCMNARDLLSLASTLNEADQMRVTVAKRFGVGLSVVPVPKWNRDVIARFKAAGGRVKCERSC